MDPNKILIKKFPTDFVGIWAILRKSGETLYEQLFSMSSVWQLGIILVAGLLSWAITRPPARRFNALGDDSKTSSALSHIYHSLAVLIWPALAASLTWAALVTFRKNGMPNDLLRIATSLCCAAVAVRLLTSNMEKGLLRSTIIWTARVMAALYILHLLIPAIDALESLSFTISDTKISVWNALTSIAVAGLALWIGRILGDAAQARLKNSTSLTPSMSGLLGQFSKIALIVVAVFIALTVVGIPLSGLTIFGSGVGVGVGFGLKSIFSNFISGIIILFEKSIQVGDFIELQSGIRGQVKEINIRSTLVMTNDFVDILVPNEEFIVAQVINWTLRDPRRRLRVPFGVAYGTDKELVKKAGLEAAAAVEWTDGGKGREPDVWLVGFGDSSLNFELVVWLEDASVKRPASVEAEYYWALHSALLAHDIEIPFPQRDINIRQPAKIDIGREDDAA